MTRHRYPMTWFTTALLLAGCGGRSPAEEAYLAEIQEKGSAINLSDPDGDLKQGNFVCPELKNTKILDRYTAVAIMEQQMGVPIDTVVAALHHLCPDAKDGTGYENW